MTRRCHRLPLVLAVVGSLAVASGCASSPDIPEQSKETKYQSARESGNESNSESGEGSLPTTGAPGETQASSSSASGLPEATGPIAHVDGEPIPAERFNSEIQKVAKSKQFPPQLVRKFQSRLVDRLIDRALIDRAIEKASIEVEDEAIDEKLEEVRAKFEQRAKAAGKSVEGQSLEQLTQRLGISGDELRDSLRQSIAIEKLLVQRGLEMPTKKDVEAYYEKNKSKFKQSERVRARHILVRVKPKADKKTWKEAETKIQELHKKATAQDAPDFAELAREHSQGPRASKGGDLGFASRAQMKKMDPKFAETAFSMKKGEISKPIKTRYGWHVVKTVDHKKAEVVPFEKVRDKLEEKLRNQKVKKQLESYVKELRKKAEIEKHPDNIE
jgi:peptidyl-prolyl cis-trans isomerase C